MKKKLLFLSLIFSLLVSNGFSQTVYITKTGDKFHIESCRYLSKSSYPITLSDAKAKGYDACSVCRPTGTVTSTPSYTPTPRVTTTAPTSQSVQCSATTKAGSQCKRMTKSSNGNCWQHGGGR